MSGGGLGMQQGCMHAATRPVNLIGTYPYLLWVPYRRYLLHTGTSG